MAAALARKVRSVAERDRWWYLVLEADVAGAPYVQLAVHESALLAEVRSDDYWIDGPPLDGSVVAAMEAAGWSAPEGIDAGRPHWWIQREAPYDADTVCGELVLWFATGFNLGEDVSTSLTVFPGDPLEDEDAG